jgi:hypothetical protein
MRATLREELWENGPSLKLIWGIVLFTFVIAALLMPFDRGPTALLVAIIGCCIAQGLWRGALHTVSILIASIAALLIGPALGRAIDPMIASISGNSGLLNRAVSVGLGVLLILLVVSTVSTLIMRKLVIRPDVSPKRHSLDRWIGGGIGAAYGTILGIAILWVPLAMAPLARIQAEGSPPEAVPQWPKRILSLSDRIRKSAVGSLAESTNPIRNSRFLTLAADFAKISRNDEAVQQLTNSQPMKDLRALPTVLSAMRTLETDAAVGPIIRREIVLTPEILLDLAQSPAVLRVIENPDLLREVEPVIGTLEAEIRRVAASLGPG